LKKRSKNRFLPFAQCKQADCSFARKIGKQKNILNQCFFGKINFKFRRAKKIFMFFNKNCFETKGCYEK
jgi:hypothetical protein